MKNKFTYSSSLYDYAIKYKEYITKFSEEELEYFDEEENLDPNLETVEFYFSSLINKLENLKFIGKFKMDKDVSEVTTKDNIIYEREVSIDPGNDYRSIEDTIKIFNDINFIKDDHNKITINIESYIYIKIEINFNDIKDIKKSVETINKFNL